MPDTGIAIIGAGFGGIGMAIRLKRAGFTDFVLLEQANDIGGTWRDNIYPGCACDIPSLLYSFSFSPHAGWSRRYPSQAEIHAYLRDCVTKDDLWPHIRLGVTLREARFDQAISIWRLRCEGHDDCTAGILVLGTGALHQPAWPDIPGLDVFRGPVFHSARWDYGVDLAGKQVAVIGTGASAAQFVPRIAGPAGLLSAGLLSAGLLPAGSLPAASLPAASLTVFQRSASWVLPKHDPVTGGTRRFLLRHVPMARRFARAWIYWTHEARAAGFLGATWLLRTAERRARSFAKHQIHDTAIREALTPVYEIGCKRIVLSNDYLPVFNEPSVTLETGAIAHIGPDAVVMASGRHHKADVLILATGFRATEALAGIHITGQTGQSLADRWRDGAQARLGVAVPDFPNMFLLAGPNTGLGHNSLVFMLEAQIGHILRAIQRMRRHCAMRIEVRADADARFAGWLGRRMAGTVWLSGCRSWYLDRAGRNTTLWPGFSVGYWLRLRFGRSAYTMTKVPGPLPDPASTDH